jgi:hypothetical protein
VTVTDSLPPVFDPPAVATDCLWPPNHTLHLFELGKELSAAAKDLCDGGTSTVRIKNVVSDQPDNTVGDGNTTHDVSFGDGALCIRAERSAPLGERHYTVTLEAKDKTGNIATRDVVIRVPKDQGGKAKCTTGDLAPEVAENDPRCTEGLPVGPMLLPNVNAFDGNPVNLGAVTPGNEPGCAIEQRERSPSGVVYVTLLAAALLTRRRRRA